jgi:quercetin dioxygenase-like cupin family protein
MTDISWADLVPGVRVRRLVDDQIGLVMGELEVDPGQEMPWHRHNVQEGVVIVAGRAEGAMPETVIELGPGQGAVFPATVPHRMRNVGDTVMRLVFSFPAAQVTREWLEC